MSQSFNLKNFADSSLAVGCRTLAKKLDGFEGLSLPPASAYLYKQSAVKRCSAKRCAGTLGTL